MQSNNFVTKIFDVLEEELGNQSSESLKRCIQVEDLDNLEEVKNSRSLIVRALKESRDRRRANLIEGMEKERVYSYEPVKFENPFLTFTRLLNEGKIPAQMTVAFRDGNEVSEEELLGMLQDLKDLGIDLDDEQESD